MRTPSGRYLGRKHDSTDFRDHRFAMVHREALTIQPPPRASLRHALPPCFDQGQEGSCGPNSGAGMMAHLFKEIKDPFSRNQIYWSVRAIEGDTGEDGGVETRDVLRVLATVGAASELLWPYNNHTLFTAPPAPVIEAAGKNKILSYSRLTDAEHFMSCIGIEGFSFILGFTCFASIDSDALAKTGVMPMPASTERQIGGHDVLVVGYDTDFKNSAVFKKSGVDPALVSDIALEIRNSWGPSWGDNGHFWMPMPYALDTTLANDAWTGRRYETPVGLFRSVPAATIVKPSATQIAAGVTAGRKALNDYSGWASSMVNDAALNSFVSTVGTAVLNTK